MQSHRWQGLFVYWRLGQGNDTPEEQRKVGQENLAGPTGQTKQGLGQRANIVIKWNKHYRHMELYVLNRTGDFGQSNTSWRLDIRTPESLLKNTTVALKEVEKAYGPAFSHTEWSKTCIAGDTALHPLSYHLCCLWSLNAALFCLPAAPAWAGLHQRSRSSKNEMFHPTVVGLYLTIQSQTQKLWHINKT